MNLLNGFCIFEFYESKSHAVKKQNIFLFLLITLLSSCSSKEHLLFNNVPIDGRLDKFAGELTKSGFIISDSTKKNEIILNADFLNKKCRLN